MRFKKFVACNDGQYPGFIAVGDAMEDKNIITYIGENEYGWWYWKVEIREEDMNDEFLGHIMEDPGDYNEKGFSAAYYDSFTECVCTAFES